ncbi:MAG TPA: hypothetical protein VK488_07200 [Gaiellaceae bacterium]|nr:hypothetical protein [Gaiellaceae bacterium]
MLRIALGAAVLAALVLVVPTAAQVGSGKIAFTNDAGVYTIEADGTGLTLLRAGAARLGGWSPDGSQIAFTAVDPGAVNKLLIVMNADGSGKHLVASGPEIALGRHPWSPDGARLAWGPVPVEPGEIYTASAAGGDVRQLTFERRPKDPPEWSPDGSELVYSELYSELSSEVFVVAADGISPPRPLARSRSGSSQPTWSPNGGSIAFVDEEGIYAVRPDGTDLHSIVPSGYPFDPTWSPDGSKILFETSKNSRQNKYGFFGREIYVVDADGSHENRLTDLAPFSRYDSMPTWSPDGNRILFARRFQSQEEWTMNPDGTCEEPFRDFPMDGASWQPLPDAPPLPERRCQAIAVETAIRPFHRYSALLTVTIANDGTEPLTNVVLDTTAHNDVSVVGAGMGNHPQACSLVVRHIRCRTANLARGDRVQVFVTLAARRVRIPRSSYLRLRTAFNVTTDEEVLPTPSESGELVFELSHCTTGMRGSGRIDGTRLAERICGRQRADRIHPQEGKDVVSAGGGADVVFAVDGKVDRISCGAGRDTVVADRRDHVARDCERVERR